MAHVCEDPGLLSAFARGEDIHASTAAAIMGIPLAEVKTPQRRLAKAVNFGLSYGQTAYGLAQATGLTHPEAEDFIRAYFERPRSLLSRLKMWKGPNLLPCRVWWHGEKPYLLTAP